MSYYSAFVNSKQTACVGEIKESPDHGIIVPGVFRWDLCDSLDLFADNWWGISVKKALISDKISVIRRNKEFVLEFFDGQKWIHTDLCDHTAVVNNIPTLINILNKPFGVIFGLDEANHISIKLKAETELRVGRKILSALGFENRESGPSSLFRAGTYIATREPKFEAVFEAKCPVVYIALNVVRPTQFNKDTLPVVYVTTPGKPDCKEGQITDLIQCPLTSMEISFLDENGSVVQFTPEFIDDFLFSIEFCLKKVVPF